MKGIGIWQLLGACLGSFVGAAICKSTRAMTWIEARAGMWVDLRTADAREAFAYEAQLVIMMLCASFGWWLGTEILRR
jgi:hypothetical protein